MSEMPKNCKIVRAEAISDSTVVLIVKSECRHYSMIELMMVHSVDGTPELHVTNVKNRCGIKKCARAIL